MQTPKLLGLNDALGRLVKHTEDVADALHKRMDRVGKYTVEGINKLGGVVDNIETTAKSIHDATNQMTNGGPPLEVSPDSPDGQGT